MLSLNYLHYMTPFRQQLLELLEDCDYDWEDLARLTGKPRSTVYDNLFVLMHHKVMSKYAEILPDRKLGRPRIVFVRTDVACETDIGCHRGLGFDKPPSLEPQGELAGGTL
jgi:hypothetical protein